MKIAVLGAGAMGMLIGGKLSTAHDVLLVDVNESVVNKINADGVVIHEKDGTTQCVHPRAAVHTEHEAPADLVIVFVKAMYSASALNSNRSLIGEHTLLMTLQNGSGHEDTLTQFVDAARVIIGTTQHNSSIRALGEVNHGGAGHTYMGGITADCAPLEQVAQAFCAAGLEASVDAHVKRLIWRKLFTNVSASALTAVLRCPLGYIAENAHAWALCTQLVKEAVAVAAGDGECFDWAEELESVRKVCVNAPNGYTSIYADLTAGRKTEVDTISGSVVKASARVGVPAPTHATIVALIHAMEEKRA